VQVRRADLAQTATTEDVIVAVHDLVPTVDAIIVQLPLPRTVDVNATLAEIPRHKDVDVINPFHANDVDAIDAPVALAVLELLARGHVDPAGKRAVVVGAGRLVGAPTAKLLKKRGAEVSMFTLEEGSIEDLKVADIIVCGAGNPGFIKPEHIKEGVAIIDAGASESEGVIRGDADPACAEKASVFTPVPGGVGPVAVAKIFENLFTLVNAK
jgi:methylenetetrahydrofolate dehydrogenase (NADP+)/methenyltetrahydrofolate cyclohydrolase